MLFFCFGEVGRATFVIFFQHACNRKPSAEVQLLYADDHWSLTRNVLACRFHEYGLLMLLSVAYRIVSNGGSLTFFRVFNVDWQSQDMIWSAKRRSSVEKLSRMHFCQPSCPIKNVEGSSAVFQKSNLNPPGIWTRHLLVWNMALRPRFARLASSRAKKQKLDFLKLLDSKFFRIY